MRDWVTSRCAGCLHVNGKTCDAILEPWYVWRTGHKCWAYTDDPSVMLQMVEMIYAVYSDNGNMAGSTRQKLHDEIAYWRAEKEKRETRRSSIGGRTCGF